MKKKFAAITTSLLLFCTVSLAQAALTTIGTASYLGSDYKLIWDNDNNGNSIVWLDYSRHAYWYNQNYWEGQNYWAAGLDSFLTYNIDAAYTVTWDDTGWRLPSAGTDPQCSYNQITSEMGHLFYTELGNQGWQASDDNWGLNNTGDFDNLIASDYWSGTENAGYPDSAWYFDMYNGFQCTNSTDHELYGLAVCSAQVSEVPIPAAIWLLGSGLIGLVGLRRKKFRE